MVEEGSPAPDFELRSDTGETVRLSSLRGKPRRAGHEKTIQDEAPLPDL
jgi:hypothetical protein